MLNQDSSPIDSYLKSGFKASSDFHVTYDKSYERNNSIILSLIDYAKAEKSLREIDAKFRCLVDNIHSVKSMNMTNPSRNYDRTKYPKFTKNEDVTYQLNLGKQKKEISKINRLITITDNISNLIGLSSEIDRNSKEHFNKLYKGNENEHISTRLTEKTLQDGHTANFNSNKNSYFDTNYVVEEQKNHMARKKLEVEDLQSVVDNNRKMIHGVNGKLIPLLSIFRNEERCKTEEEFSKTVKMTRFKHVANHFSELSVKQELLAPDVSCKIRLEKIWNETRDYNGVTSALSRDQPKYSQVESTLWNDESCLKKLIEHAVSEQMNLIRPLLEFSPEYIEPDDEHYQDGSAKNDDSDDCPHVQTPSLSEVELYNANCSRISAETISKVFAESHDQGVAFVSYNNISSSSQSYDELEEESAAFNINTPNRSISPSSFQLLDNNKKTKYIVVGNIVDEKKDKVVTSPVALQSIYITNNDEDMMANQNNTEREAGDSSESLQQTEFSSTLNEILSEGELLISEGELSFSADCDFEGDGHLKKWFCTKKSNEPSDGEIGVLNSSSKFSSGEIDLPNKSVCSSYVISEGEILSRRQHHLERGFEYRISDIENGE